MPKLYSKVSKSTKLFFKIAKQIKLKYKNKGNKINLYTYSGSAGLKKTIDPNLTQLEVQNKIATQPNSPT